MTRTLHRAPASERTHHTLDFLHGIDLDRVHLRRPRGRAPGLLLSAVVLIAVAGALAAVLLVTSPTEPTIELSGHDSGIAQALATREAARQVTPHDSGIEFALRAR